MDRKIKRAVGVLVVFLPFIGLFLVMCYLGGIKTAALVAAITSLITAFIAVCVYYGMRLFAGNETADDGKEQALSLVSKSFPNGMTVADLKTLIAGWPETTASGEPCEVFIETQGGLSSPALAAWPLNARKDDNCESADILLSSVAR